MIQVYCGDGKGKTTAAIGQAVRAAGRGKRVLVARFLKTDDSGEVCSLQKIPQIEVVPCERSFGFYRSMSEKVKSEAVQYYQELFERVALRAVQEHWDMLILDEIMAVCQYQLVSEEHVLHFLEQNAGNLEIILTGRNPSDAILAYADYVTEMKKKRHPYDKGVLAREGIEY